jgi:hypothetical protein
VALAGCQSARVHKRCSAAATDMEVRVLLDTGALDGDYISASFADILVSRGFVKIKSSKQVCMATSVCVNVNEEIVFKSKIFKFKTSSAKQILHQVLKIIQQLLPLILLISYFSNCALSFGARRLLFLD